MGRFPHGTDIGPIFTESPEERRSRVAKGGMPRAYSSEAGTFFFRCDSRESSAQSEAISASFFLRLQPLIRASVSSASGRVWNSWLNTSTTGLRR